MTWVVICVGVSSSTCVPDGTVWGALMGFSFCSTEEEEEDEGHVKLDDALDEFKIVNASSI